MAVGGLQQQDRADILMAGYFVVVDTQGKGFVGLHVEFVDHLQPEDGSYLLEAEDDKEVDQVGGKGRLAAWNVVLGNLDIQLELGLEGMAVLVVVKDHSSCCTLEAAH